MVVLIYFRILKLQQINGYTIYIHRGLIAFATIVLKSCQVNKLNGTFFNSTSFKHSYKKQPLFPALFAFGDDFKQT